MASLAGCKKQQAIVPAPYAQTTFTATIGDNGNKTELQPNYKVFWSDDDKILVSDGYTTDMFTTTMGGSTTATFTGETSLSGDTYIAAYPTIYGYNETTINGTTITFTLPATQPLMEGTFADGVAPMVAKSSDKTLAFKNVCGAICVRLYSELAFVKKIVVTSKSGAKINGTYKVSYDGDRPVVELTSGNTNTIILTTKTPVRLSDDENNPTLFYVMLPAGTYSGGFNIKVYDPDGIMVLEQDFAPANSIEQNNIKLLKVTEISATSVPGTINGLFSTSPYTQVLFSKGQLAQADYCVYYLTDNQYDYIDPTTYFDWYTACYIESWAIYDSDIETSFGTGWRTPTVAEWRYLMDTERMIFDKAAYTNWVTITGSHVPGIVFYPDNYNGDEYTTGTDWAAFEAAGCVFLPAAGCSDGNEIFYVGSGGGYWSSSESYWSGFACGLTFYSGGAGIDAFCTAFGYPVRLVLDVE